MKFPKSVHPEGWLDHIDRSKESAPVARPAGQPLKPRMTRPSAKIRATDPLGTAPVGYVPPQPMAAAIPPVYASTAPAVAAPGANPERRSSNAMPWVVGVGAGVVLLGVAATMSRQFTGNEAPALPPTVVGEATTPVAPASSPEDTLLAEAPPAAGSVTPAAEAQAEPATPAVEPAPKLAAAPAAAPVPAPAAKMAETPKATEKAVEAPRVAQAAPVTRTLAPQPQTWVLSQAEPPAAALRDTTPAPTVSLQPAAPVATQQPVSPVAPVAPVALPPSSETTPPVAQAVPPVTQPQPEAQPPVVAQQTPSVTSPVTPPVANPEDTGITIKVREALASDTTLAAVPIAVSTDQGVVKLEGQAPDSLAKERATVVAASAAGVRGVDNRLTLPPVTLGAVTQNSGS
ncbi:BON domain-containing protein [Roseateles sp. DC23W]|uniref:BON domain-containing protein n=1 Tax=Pelomonas dachongensis TaxID=3299029 RepID=A0ABW7ERZ9_9BURK